jgi:hypothetical protein
MDEPGFNQTDAAPVLAMLPLLPSLALAELEAALAVKLSPAPSAAKRRVAELHYLARLLYEIKPLPEHLRAESRGDRGRRQSPAVEAPRLNRTIYEARQPLEAPDAPSAQTLVARYQSWRRTCQAAYGLLEDGRYLGSSNPYQQPLSGKSRIDYTIDDVRGSIRRCAQELGRIPSAGDYHHWNREAKRIARERGARFTGTNPSAHPLIPGIAVVYRLYPRAGNKENRWRAALADVGLTEAEIAAARDVRLGLTAKTEKPKPDKKLLALPLKKAVERARAEGLSLDCLAGRSLTPGDPPAADACFAPDALLAARDATGVPDERLRRGAGLQLGPWRRLLKGQIEPTLAQVAALAALVERPLDALLGS